MSPRRNAGGDRLARIHRRLRTELRRAGAAVSRPGAAAAAIRSGAAAQRSLRELSWTRHFVPQNYSGDWSVIALRAKAGAVHPVQMIYSDPTARVFEDAPALGRTPYFCEVLSQFACPLRSVRLMRLTPGSGIKTHQDHDLDVESGAVRFHIPIVTNAAVEFLLNGAPVALAAGETWYLRLSDPHSVVNRGTTDRIHLVIDAEANAWVRESLSRGDAG
jgi:hypothetical protein